ncbi:MAG: exo-alpha-sialidase [Chitinophagaceae bacterium]|nr:exo-alpha-sialidase [Chitinophagaceae bacterium]
MKGTGICMCLVLCFVVPVCAQTTWRQTTRELIVSNPSFEACHASTIVELPGGQLMAAWFGGSNEGNPDVEIWISRLTSGSWSKPVAVANGKMNDSLRYPTWNPVLFRDRHGILHLFYKVGPNPREWWGMIISSGDNGNSWSAPQRLPDGILGPIRNKPLQLDDGTILAPSSTETENRWRAHIERSTDDGKTWNFIPVDTAGSFDVIQPSILKYDDGRMQALCRSKQGYVMQSWSADEGKTWSRLSPTTLVNPNSGVDAASLNNGGQLIVYNPDVPGKEWYNGRSKLRVAFSTDGKAWKDVGILEDENRGEFSYPAVIQTSDNKIHITYTYDRRNIKHVVLERR